MDKEDSSERSRPISDRSVKGEVSQRISKIQFSENSSNLVRCAPNERATFFVKIDCPDDHESLPLTFKWSRGEVPIESCDRFKITQTSNAVQLAVEHVQRDDAGHYTLYAKTKNGEVIRKDVELIVEDRSVGDDPPIFLRRLGDLAVKVGTRTRLLVELRSSTDVKVTWYRNDRRICENDRIKHVNEGSFYCLEIAPVTLEDGGQWMCMAENLGGRNSCIGLLNVLVPKAYKSPEFVEELRAVLTEQGTVSLECKVIGVPTPILRWFKDSKEIKAGDVFALTANPDDPTSLGTYTCEAVNCMGKAYSSSKVHVVGKGSREGSLKPADSVQQSAPPPIFTTELKGTKVRIGDTIILGCQVVVPPWPKTVAWYNKEGRVESGEKYKIIEDGLGVYMIEIKPSESCDEGDWKCVVTSNEGAVGISTCHVEMEIPKNHRKPRFMESLKAVLTEEGLVSFECKVVGFPTPILKWFKDGQELKPGDVYQLTGSNSLGTYCCIAKNCMGETSSTAVLTIEDIENQLNDEERLFLSQRNQPPKFIVGLKSQEAKINEEFQFSVAVKATPDPTLSWFRDELPVELNERYNPFCGENNTWHLQIRCIEFVDQAEWKCVATNDFGASVTSCFLKLLIPRHYKKPRFLECLRAVLTEEGAVNLECKVIGVPQPVLKWYKDGVELKPGDIHRIISGEDGTCCLGTYTCEARNCMGVVASSASLLGFEDAPKNQQDNVPLQRDLSLSTIQEERTSQLYETPAGDITIDEKGDVSFSFDGKEVSVSLYETPDLTEEEALQIVEMYADQISEHVTEHNVVELPPLRFVKETSQSGNLLMEAVVIDIAPEYFSHDEDRTEAGMEDFTISEVTVHQLSSRKDELGYDKETEEYVQRNLEKMDEELQMQAPQRKRKKSRTDQQEEYFSFSQSRTSGPSSHGDDDTETDLPTFASAQDSSNLMSIDRDQEVPDKDSVLRDAERLIEADALLDIEEPIPPKRKRGGKKGTDSDSSKTCETEAQLQDISGEVGDGLKAMRPSKEITDENEIRSNLEALIPLARTLKTIEKNLSVVENEVMAQSGMMMSVASAEQSIGIIKNVAEPLQQIQSKMRVYSGEIPLEALFESLEEDVREIHRSLQVIEKCVEMDEVGETLIQRTSVCVIESSGEQFIQALDVVQKIAQDFERDRLKNEISLIVDDMKQGIQITKDTIKSQALMQEASALEAAQHFTETVAKVQNIPETLPFEKFTLATLPTEADALKLICRPVVRIQQALENIEHDLSLEENEEQLFTKIHETFLEKLTEPISELEAEIRKIDQKSMSSVGKETLEQKINIAILDIITPPLFELKKGMEVLSQQSSANIHSGMVSVSIIESMVPPLQEIQSGLAQLGQDIESGQIREDFGVDTADAQRLLQSIAQSVLNFESNTENLRSRVNEQLQSSLFDLKSNLSYLIGSILDSPLNKYHLTLLENLKRPIDDLNYCLRQTEEKSMSGSLSDIIDPLHVLHDKAKLSEDILILTGQSTSNDPNIQTLQKIRQTIRQIENEVEKQEQKVLDEDIFKPEQTAEEMEQSLPSLHEAKSISDKVKMEVIKTLTTIEELQSCIAGIQEQPALQVPASEVKSLSVGEDISVLKTLATPLQDMLQCVAKLKEIATFETVQNLAENTDIKILQQIAKPLQNVLDTFKIVSHQRVMEHAEPLSSQENLSILKTLADPLQELHNCIGMIEQETSLAETLYDVSDLQTPKIAQPLNELQFCLEQIIHRAVEEVEDLSTMDEISGIKTIADVPPTGEAAITQQILTVEQADSLTSAHSVYKTNAQILFEDLKRCLAKVSQHLPEIEPTSLKVEKVSQLQATMSKIKDLENCVATVQQGSIHEPLESFSEQDDRSDLKTFAESVKDLQSCIVNIQNEIVLEKEELLSSQNDISALKTLAEPLQELRQSLLVIQNDTIERIEDIVVHPSLSISGTKAEEILPFIVNITEIQVLETLESLMNKDIAGPLKQIIQPLHELQQAALQTHEQHHISQVESLTTMEGVSKLETLGKPLFDLKQSILNIQEQFPLLSFEECPPFSVIKEKSIPLYKLLKCIQGTNIEVFENLIEFSTQDEVSALKTTAESLLEDSRKVGQAEQMEIEVINAPDITGCFNDGIKNINNCLTFVQDNEIQKLTKESAGILEYSLKELQSAFETIHEELSSCDFYLRDEVHKNNISNALVKLKQCLDYTNEAIQSNEELNKGIDGPFRDIEKNFKDILDIVPNLEVLLGQEMIKQSEVEIVRFSTLVESVSQNYKNLEYLQKAIAPLNALMGKGLEICEDNQAQLDKSSGKMVTLQSHIMASFSVLNDISEQAPAELVKATADAQNHLISLSNFIESSESKIRLLQLVEEINIALEPIHNLNKTLMDKLNETPIRSDNEILEILSPVKEAQDCLMALQQVLDLSTEERVENFLDMFGSTIHDLKSKLDLIEGTVLSSNEDFSKLTDNDVLIIQSITTPLQSLQDVLHNPQKYFGEQKSPQTVEIKTIEKDDVKLIPVLEMSQVQEIELAKLEESLEKRSLLEEEVEQLKSISQERELYPEENDKLQDILQKLDQLDAEVHETLVTAKIIDNHAAELFVDIREQAELTDEIKKNVDNVELSENLDENYSMQIDNERRQQEEEEHKSIGESIGEEICESILKLKRKIQNQDCKEDEKRPKLEEINKESLVVEPQNLIDKSKDIEKDKEFAEESRIILLKEQEERLLKSKKCTTAFPKMLDITQNCLTIIRKQKQKKKKTSHELEENEIVFNELAEALENLNKILLSGRQENIEIADVIGKVLFKADQSSRLACSSVSNSVLKKSILELQTQVNELSEEFPILQVYLSKEIVQIPIAEIEKTLTTVKKMEEINLNYFKQSLESLKYNILDLVDNGSDTIEKSSSKIIKMETHVMEAFMAVDLISQTVPSSIQHTLQDIQSALISISEFIESAQVNIQTVDICRQFQQISNPLQAFRKALSEPFGPEIQETPSRNDENDSKSQDSLQQENLSELMQESHQTSADDITKNLKQTMGTPLSELQEYLKILDTKEQIISTEQKNLLTIQQNVDEVQKILLDENIKESQIKQDVCQILLKLRECLVHTYDAGETSEHNETANIKLIYQKIIEQSPDIEALLVSEIIKPPLKELEKSIKLADEIKTKHESLSKVGDIVEPLNSLQKALCDVTQGEAVTLEKSTGKIIQLQKFLMEAFRSFDNISEKMPNEMQNSIALTQGGFITIHDFIEATNERIHLVELAEKTMAMSKTLHEFNELLKAISELPETFEKEITFEDEIGEKPKDELFEGDKNKGSTKIEINVTKTGKDKELVAEIDEINLQEMGTEKNYKEEMLQVKPPKSDTNLETMQEREIDQESKDQLIEDVKNTEVIKPVTAENTEDLVEVLDEESVSAEVSEIKPEKVKIGKATGKIHIEAETVLQTSPVKKVEHSNLVNLNEEIRENLSELQSTLNSLNTTPEEGNGELQQLIADIEGLQSNIQTEIETPDEDGKAKDIKTKLSETLFKLRQCIVHTYDAGITDELEKEKIQQVERAFKDLLNKSPEVEIIFVKSLFTISQEELKNTVRLAQELSSINIKLCDLNKISKPLESLQDSLVDLTETVDDVTIDKSSSKVVKLMNHLMGAFITFDDLNRNLPSQLQGLIKKGQNEFIEIHDFIEHGPESIRLMDLADAVESLPNIMRAINVELRELIQLSCLLAQNVEEGEIEKQESKGEIQQVEDEIIQTAELNEVRVEKIEEGILKRKEDKAAKEESLDVNVQIAETSEVKVENIQEESLDIKEGQSEIKESAGVHAQAAETSEVKAEKIEEGKFETKERKSEIKESAGAQAQAAESSEVKAEKIVEGKLETKAGKAEIKESAGVQAQAAESSEVKAEKIEKGKLENKEGKAEIKESAGVQAQAAESSEVKAEKIEKGKLETKAGKAEKLQSAGVQAQAAASSEVKEEKIEKGKLETKEGKAEMMENAGAQAQAADASEVKAEKIEEGKLETKEGKAEIKESAAVHVQAAESSEVKAEKIEKGKLETKEGKAEIKESAGVQAQAAESSEVEAEKIEEGKLETKAGKAEILQSAGVQAQAAGSSEVKAEKIEKGKLETKEGKAEMMESAGAQAQTADASEVKAEKIEEGTLETKEGKTEIKESAGVQAQAAESSEVKAEKIEKGKLETKEGKAEIKESAGVQAQAAESSEVKAEKIEEGKLETKAGKAELMESAAAQAQAAESSEVKAENIEEGKLETKEGKAEIMESAGVKVQAVEFFEVKPEKLEEGKLEIIEGQAEIKESAATQAQVAESSEVKAEKIEEGKLETKAGKAELMESAAAQAQAAESSEVKAENIEEGKLETKEGKAEIMESAGVKVQAVEFFEVKPEKLEEGKLEIIEGQAEIKESAATQAQVAESSEVKAEKIEEGKLETKEGKAEIMENAGVQAQAAESSEVKAEKIEEGKLETKEGKAEIMESAGVQTQAAESSEVRAEKIEEGKMETKAGKAEKLQSASVQAQAAESSEVKPEKIEEGKLETKEGKAEIMENAGVQVQAAESFEVKAEKIEKGNLETKEGKAEIMENIGIQVQAAESSEVKAEKIEKGKLETKEGKAEMMESADAQAQAAESSEVKAEKIEEGKLEIKEGKAEIMDSAGVQAQAAESSEVKAEKIEEGKLETKAGKAEIKESAGVQVQAAESSEVKADKLEEGKLEIKEGKAEIMESAAIQAQTAESSEVKAEKIEERKLETKQGKAEIKESAGVQVQAAESSEVKAEKIEKGKLETKEGKAEMMESASAQAHAAEASEVRADKIEKGKLETKEGKAGIKESAGVQVQAAESSEVKADKLEEGKLEIKEVKAEIMESACVQVQAAEASEVKAENIEEGKLESKARTVEVMESAGAQAPAAESSEVKAENIEEGNLETKEGKAEIMENIGIQVQAAEFSEVKPEKLEEGKLEIIEGQAEIKESATTQAQVAESSEVKAEKIEEGKLETKEGKAEMMASAGAQAQVAESSEVKAEKIEEGKLETKEGKTEIMESAAVHVQAAEASEVKAENIEEGKLETKEGKAEIVDSAGVQAQAAESSEVKTEKIEEGKLEPKEGKAEIMESADVKVQAAEFSEVKAEKLEEGKLEIKEGQAEIKESAAIQAQVAEASEVKAEKIEEGKLETKEGKAEIKESAGVQAQAAESSEIKAEKTEEGKLEIKEGKAEIMESAGVQGQAAESSEVKAEKIEEGRHKGLKSSQHHVTQTEVTQSILAKITNQVFETLSEIESSMKCLGDSAVAGTGQLQEVIRELEVLQTILQTETDTPIEFDKQSDIKNNLCKTLFKLKQCLVHTYDSGKLDEIEKHKIKKIEEVCKDLLDKSPAVEILIVKDIFNISQEELKNTVSLSQQLSSISTNLSKLENLAKPLKGLQDSLTDTTATAEDSKIDKSSSKAVKLMNHLMGAFMTFDDVNSQLPDQLQSLITDAQQQFIKIHDFIENSPDSIRLIDLADTVEPLTNILRDINMELSEMIKLSRLPTEEIEVGIIEDKEDKGDIKAIVVADAQTAQAFEDKKEKIDNGKFGKNECEAEKKESEHAKAKTADTSEVNAEHVEKGKLEKKEDKDEAKKIEDAKSHTTDTFEVRAETIEEVDRKKGQPDTSELAEGQTAVASEVKAVMPEKSREESNAIECVQAKIVQIDKVEPANADEAKVEVDPLSSPKEKDEKCRNLSALQNILISLIDTTDTGSDQLQQLIGELEGLQIAIQTETETPVELDKEKNIESDLYKTLIKLKQCLVHTYDAGKPAEMNKPKFMKIKEIFKDLLDKSPAVEILIVKDIFNISQEELKNTVSLSQQLSSISTNLSKLENLAKPLKGLQDSLTDTTATAEDAKIDKSSSKAVKLMNHLMGAFMTFDDVNSQLPDQLQSLITDAQQQFIKIHDFIETSPDSIQFIDLADTVEPLSNILRDINVELTELIKLSCFPTEEIEKGIIGMAGELEEGKLQKQERKAEVNEIEAAKKQNAEISEVKAEKIEKGKLGTMEGKAEVSEIQEVKAQTAETSEVKPEKIKEGKLEKKKGKAEVNEIEVEKKETAESSEVKAEKIEKGKLGTMEGKAEVSDIQEVKAQTAETSEVKPEKIEEGKLEKKKGKAEVNEIEVAKKETAESSEVKAEKIEKGKLGTMEGKAEVSDIQEVKAQTAETSEVKPEKIEEGKLEKKKGKAEVNEIEVAKKETAESSEVKAEKIEKGKLGTMEGKAEVSDIQEVKAQTAETSEVKPEKIEEGKLEKKKGKAEVNEIEVAKKETAESSEVKAEKIEKGKLGTMEGKAEVSDIQEVKAQTAETSEVKAEKIEKGKLEKKKGKAEVNEIEVAKKETAETSEVKAEKIEKGKLGTMEGKAEVSDIQEVKAQTAETSEVKPEKIEEGKLEKKKGKAEVNEIEVAKKETAESSEVKAEKIEKGKLGMMEGKAEVSDIQEVKAQTAETSEVKPEKIEKGKLEKKEGKAEVNEIETGNKQNAETSEVKAEKMEKGKLRKKKGKAEVSEVIEVKPQTAETSEVEAEKVEKEKLEKKKGKAEVSEIEVATPKTAETSEVKAEKVVEGQLEKEKAEVSEMQTTKPQTAETYEVRAEKIEKGKLEKKKGKAEINEIEVAKKETAETSEVKAEKIEKGKLGTMEGKAEVSDIQEMKAQTAETSEVKAEKIEKGKLEKKKGKAEVNEIEVAKKETAETSEVKAEKIEKGKLGTMEGKAEVSHIQEVKAQTAETSEVKPDKIEEGKLEKKKGKAEVNEIEVAKKETAESSEVKAEKIEKGKLGTMEGKAEVSDIQEVKAQTAETSEVKPEKIEKGKLEKKEGKPEVNEIETGKKQNAESSEVKAEKMEKGKLRKKKGKAEVSEIIKVKPQTAETSEVKAENVEKEKLEKKKGKSEVSEIEVATAKTAETSEVKAKKVVEEQLEKAEEKAEVSEMQTTKPPSADSSEVRAEKIEKIDDVKAQSAETPEVKTEKEKVKIKRKKSKAEVRTVENIQKQSAEICEVSAQNIEKNEKANAEIQTAVEITGSGGAKAQTPETAEANAEKIPKGKSKKKYGKAETKENEVTKVQTSKSTITKEKKENISDESNLEVKSEDDLLPESIVPKKSSMIDNDSAEEIELLHPKLSRFELENKLVQNATTMSEKELQEVEIFVTNGTEVEQVPSKRENVERKLSQESKLSTNRYEAKEISSTKEARKDTKPIKTVKRRPTFDVKLSNRTVSEGGTIKLTCGISGEDITQVWYKDKHVLSPSAKYTITCKNGLYSLEICNTTVEDSGIYTCVAANRCGEIETSSIITIYESPKGPSESFSPPIFTRRIQGKYIYIHNKIAILTLTVKLNGADANFQL